MIRKLALYAGIAASLVACDKSKLDTRPSISIKSQSRVVPPINEAIFSITLEYADKEGDLSGIRDDSSIYYQGFLQNVRQVVGNPNYLPVFVSFPEFPEKSRGEFVIEMLRSSFYREIQNNQGGNDSNDTLIFKIAIKDRAGNVSDTVTSEPIILLGQ